MATNPIKTSDIFQDDGGLDKLLKKLEAIETVMASLVNTASKLNKASQGLNITNSEGTAAIDKQSKETNELAKEMEKYLKLLNSTNIEVEKAKLASSQLSKANKLEAEIKLKQASSLDSYRAQLKKATQEQSLLSEGQKESTDKGKKLEAQILKLTTTLNAQKKAQRESVKQRELEIKASDSAEGSYNKLSAQYSLAKIKLNAMSGAARKFTKEGKNLENEAKLMYKEMDRLQEVTGKNQLKVGGYKDAIEEAGVGLSGFTQKVKIFLKSPMVAIVSLITAGILALGKAFSQSESGMRIITKVTGYLNGLWAELVSISSVLAVKLKGVFSDPQKALKDFGKLLLNQVVNRFKGLIELLGSAGRAIGNLLTGNLKKFREEAINAGEAVAKIATGLDKDAQQKIKEGLINIGNAAAKTADQFKNLADQQRAVKLQNIELAKTLGDLERAEAILAQTAGDATLSFKEQEDAAKAQGKAIEERYQVELKIANSNLSILREEIALRRSKGQILDTLLEQELGLIQTQKQAETDLLLATKDNETEKRQLVQDRLERDLDILIDGYDNQKTINERIINNESETLEKRTDLLKETQRLGKDSFDRQIETLQEFTELSIDANDLITESDAVALNAKIRTFGLSEIIEGRLLEVVRDRKTAISDLAEAEANLFKVREDALRSKETSIVDEFEDEAEELNAYFQSLTSLTEDAKPRTIWDFLGIGVGKQDAYKSELKSALDYAKGQLNEFAALRTQLAQQALDDSNTQVSALENRLQTEIELSKLGLANKAGTIQKELELQRIAQGEALADREKAQRQQLIIDTISQASSLTTAAAKLWAQFNLAAIPLIAVMFGSFAFAKAKSFQLAKQEFSEGDYEKIGGGSHASGNDTFVGMTNSGKAGFAEKGEARAIFTEKAVQKYGDFLPDFVRDVNKGTYEGFFNKASGTSDGAIIMQSSADMSTTEQELGTIRKQGERRFSNNGEFSIETYKSLTKVYR